MKSFGKDVEVLWKDTKRIFGMPLSFTNYAIIRKPGQWVKIVEETGIFSTHVEEILAYRVDDLGVFQSMTAKLFGVGNVEIHVDDASCDKLVLRNIKKPYEVKSLLNDLVEQERMNRRVYYSEIQH